MKIYIGEKLILKCQKKKVNLMLSENLHNQGPVHPHLERDLISTNCKGNPPLAQLTPNQQIPSRVHGGFGLVAQAGVSAALEGCLRVRRIHIQCRTSYLGLKLQYNHGYTCSKAYVRAQIKCKQHQDICSLDMRSTTLAPSTG